MPYLKLYSRVISEIFINHYRYIQQRKRAPRPVQHPQNYSYCISFNGEQCTIAPDSGEAVYLHAPNGMYGSSEAEVAYHVAIVLRAERLIRERALTQGLALSIACKEAMGISTNYVKGSQMPRFNTKSRYLHLPIRAIGIDFDGGSVEQAVAKIGADVYFLQSYNDYCDYCDMVGVPAHGTWGYAIVKDGDILALYSGSRNCGSHIAPLRRVYRSSDLRDWRL